MNAKTSSLALRQPPSFSIAQLDQDPHGIFRRHRHLTPLLKRDNAGYIAIRAADFEPLAFDPRTRQLEVDMLTARGVHSGPLVDLWGNSMLMSNGHLHRKRRAPMARTFAYKLMEELRPRIRRSAEQIIEQHYAAGGLNFLDDFASLVPARIISEILGIPATDIPRFTQLVYRVSRSLSLSFLNEELPGIEEATRQLMGYVNDLLEARRREPRDDFLTAFANRAAEDSSISAAEVLSQLVTVIIAGSDTTRGGLAVQLALLLEHREQWDAVCADNALIPGAVAESLRFEPVVGTIPRFTLEDIEVGEYIVPRNNVLSLSTLAAMRDPALYVDPDRFNIRRTDHPRRLPVFGVGVHACLGEVLAKAELEESLAALVNMVPGITLAGEPLAVTGHSGIRRLNGLRVQWPVPQGT